MAVGRNVERKDGWDKVTGKARYVDDLVFPGMIHARTVRSTIARGRIRSIRFETRPPGLIVADHKDIPGKNVVKLIEDDQPCLASSRIRHMAEPILLLAHADREALLDAAVSIDYEEETPLFDAEKSGAVFKEIEIRKGDIDAGFGKADFIVESEYRTGHQEQLYIETNGMIAVPELGGITVYGSMQCPFYVHKALTELTGFPDHKVRVVALETGGGFGGKEEFPSHLACHAAVLALKAERPVKMVYDRAEDLLATTKRHPSRSRIRTGVKADGRLTAMQFDILMDGGAYVTLSPVVLSRGVIHASGPYRCDNIRVHGRAVRTHTPPNGAFRGFGAPQTLFAIEAHMDRVAERVSLDPVAFRRLNALRPGDSNATGQVMGSDCSAVEVLDEAVRRSRFAEKRAAYDGSPRGIGLSLVYHGSGFTGSGEVTLASQASLEVVPEGVRILVASTEIGQGTRTMHAQIVAETLGLPYDRVLTGNPDTSKVPNSGPTVASRTCMVVGKILQRCAEDLKSQLAGADPSDYYREHGPLVVTREYQAPPMVAWDETTYRGNAYATYAWACVVAELQLDRVTYEVKPVRLTCVQDIGRAIHPVLAAGQIEGGSAQGIGYALLEQVVMKGGKMANNQMTNYIIPTTLDTPEFEVAFFDNPYPGGPFGAKGVGELPIDGPAPAIINALRHLGLDVRRIPATPEVLMEAACSSN